MTSGYDKRIKVKLIVQTPLGRRHLTLRKEKYARGAQKGEPRVIEPRNKKKNNIFFIYRGRIV